MSFAIIKQNPKVFRLRFRPWSIWIGSLLLLGLYLLTIVVSISVQESIFTVMLLTVLLSPLALPYILFGDTTICEIDRVRHCLCKRRFWLGFIQRGTRYPFKAIRDVRVDRSSIISGGKSVYRLRLVLNDGKSTVLTNWCALILSNRRELEEIASRLRQEIQRD
jgi:hypothetical protein